MAKHFDFWPRRHRGWIAAALLGLCSIGCGTKWSAQGDDPLFGSIPRPIAPTPPPNAVGNGSETAIAPSDPLLNSTMAQRGKTVTTLPAPIGGSTLGSPASGGSSSEDFSTLLPKDRPPRQGILTGSRITNAGMASTLPAKRGDFSDLRIASPENGTNLAVQPTPSPYGGAPYGPPPPANVPAPAQGAMLPNPGSVAPNYASNPPWTSSAVANGIILHPPVPTDTVRFPPPGPTNPSSNASWTATSPNAPTPASSHVPSSMTSSSPKEPRQLDVSRISSVEEAETILASYGVQAKRLTLTDQGEWQFLCIVPQPGQAAVERRFEAKHPDKIEAVRAVLRQLSNADR